MKINMQALIIAVLFIGLLSGGTILFITSLETHVPDVTFDNGAVRNFSQNELLTSELQQIKGNATAIAVESNPFDIIGSLINKALAPLRLVRDIYRFVVNIAVQGLIYLGIDKSYSNIITNFIDWSLLVLVIIGFFLIRMLAGKDDG